MRNIIPIIFVAATVLVGCQSPKSASKPTTPGTATTMVITNTVFSTNIVFSTNTVASSKTVVVAPITVGPNTPEETASENLKFGKFAAVFIFCLTILALARRPVS